jgi:hypothetical protein
MHVRLISLVAALGFWLFASAATAQTLTPTAAGTYTPTVANSGGGSGTATGNFFTGLDSIGTDRRSYLIYSIPAGGTITSATLSLNASNIGNGPNTVGVYAVTTSPAQIAAGTAPAAATHADLGDGTQFGTAVATTNDETLTITLSADALTALNAARGGSIAFGLVNETATVNNDFVFGNSQGSAPRTLTIVQTPAPVPTLSEWAMILLGLMLAGGAAIYLQRRQQLV